VLSRNGIARKISKGQRMTTNTKKKTTAVGKEGNPCGAKGVGQAILPAHGGHRLGQRSTTAHWEKTIFRGGEGGKIITPLPSRRKPKGDRTPKGSGEKDGAEGESTSEKSVKCKKKKGG